MFNKQELIIIGVILLLAGLVTWLSRGMAMNFYVHAANFTFVVAIGCLIMASLAVMKNGGMRMYAKYRSYKKHFVPGTDGRTKPMTMREFIEEERKIKARFLPYLIVGVPMLGLAILFSQLHSIS